MFPFLAKYVALYLIEHANCYYLLPTHVTVFQCHLHFHTGKELLSVIECRHCDGGMYCESPNATSVSGPCDPGYYCTEGSNVPNPELSSSGQAGPCTAGNYCPKNTTSPLPCPLGYYSNKTRLSSPDDCEKCPFGYYCGHTGLTGYTTLCEKGFYCLRGAKVKNPDGSDDTGGPCPKGSYCLEGTGHPKGCEPGTFTNQTGQSVCQSCCVGYYCDGNSSQCDKPCPPGYYCPEGTKYAEQFPCPQGYFNNKSRSVDVK